MGRRESATVRGLRQATRSKWSRPADNGPDQCCNVCGAVDGLRVGCYRGKPYYYCREHEEVYQRLKKRE